MTRHTPTVISFQLRCIWCMADHPYTVTDDEWREISCATCESPIALTDSGRFLVAKLAPASISPAGFLVQGKDGEQADSMEAPIHPRHDGGE